MDLVLNRWEESDLQGNWGLKSIGGIKACMSVTDVFSDSKIGAIYEGIVSRREATDDFRYKQYSDGYDIPSFAKAAWCSSLIPILYISFSSSP